MYARISTEPAGSFRKGNACETARTDHFGRDTGRYLHCARVFFLLRGGSNQKQPTHKPRLRLHRQQRRKRNHPHPKIPQCRMTSPIDFASLQKENRIFTRLRFRYRVRFSDLAARGDDDYYLTHDSDGNDNSMGAIFFQSSYNDGKMDDPATVLYGHRCLPDTMFGRSCSRSIPIECADGARRYHRVSAGKCTTRCFAAVPYDNRHICTRMISRAKAPIQCVLNSIFDVREDWCAAQYKIMPVTPEINCLSCHTCLRAIPQTISRRRKMRR